MAEKKFAAYAASMATLVNPPDPIGRDTFASQADFAWLELERAAWVSLAVVGLALVLLLVIRWRDRRK